MCPITIETQGRLTLHLDALLWLDGSHDSLEGLQELLRESLADGAGLEVHMAGSIGMEEWNANQGGGVGSGTERDG